MPRVWKISSTNPSSRGRFKRQRREKSMFGDHEDDLFWFSSDEEKDPKLTARLGTTEPPVVFEDCRHENRTRKRLRDLPSEMHDNIILKTTTREVPPQPEILWEVSQDPNFDQGEEKLGETALPQLGTLSPPLPKLTFTPKQPPSNQKSKSEGFPYSVVSRPSKNSPKIYPLLRRSKARDELATPLSRPSSKEKARLDSPPFVQKLKTPAKPSKDVSVDHSRSLVSADVEVDRCSGRSNDIAVYVPPPESRKNVTAQKESSKKAATEIELVGSANCRLGVLHTRDLGSKLPIEEDQVSIKPVSSKNVNISIRGRSQVFSESLDVLGAVQEDILNSDARSRHRLTEESCNQSTAKTFPFTPFPGLILQQPLIDHNPPCRYSRLLLQEPQPPESKNREDCDRIPPRKSFDQLQRLEPRASSNPQANRVENLQSTPLRSYLSTSTINLDDLGLQLSARDESWTPEPLGIQLSAGDEFLPGDEEEKRDITHLRDTEEQKCMSERNMETENNVKKPLAQESSKFEVNLSKIASEFVSKATAEFKRKEKFEQRIQREILTKFSTWKQEIIKKSKTDHQRLLNELADEKKREAERRSRENAKRLDLALGFQERLGELAKKVQDMFTRIPSEQKIENILQKNSALAKMDGKRLASIESELRQLEKRFEGIGENVMERTILVSLERFFKKPRRARPRKCKSRPVKRERPSARIRRRTFARDILRKRGVVTLSGFKSQERERIVFLIAEARSTFSNDLHKSTDIIVVPSPTYESPKTKFARRHGIPLVPLPEFECAAVSIMTNLQFLHI